MGEDGVRQIENREKETGTWNGTDGVCMAYD